MNGTIKYCTKDCEIGEGEKCKECNNETHQCSSCNLGYFMPEDDDLKQNCQKCSIENCQECKGTKTNDICTSCGPYLVQVKENDIIKYCNYTCETGKGEKCKECDVITNQCSSCNLGYFIPEDDESKQKCQ